MMNANLDELLREAVAAAYENTPLVRERFENAGISPADIQTRADLTKIPVFTKDAMIARQQAQPPFGGNLGVPLDQIRRIYFSPGPLYEPEGVGDDDEFSLQMRRFCFEQIGFSQGDVVLVSLSYHLVPAGLLVDSVLTQMGCTVIPAGTGNKELQIKMMLDFGVTGYAGTGSYLISLIQKAEEMGYDFNHDFKLNKALLSAEPLPPSLYKTLHETYGITVGNAYATAELGVLALSMDGGMAMKLMPAPIIEVVNPETGKAVGAGEAGEVVATNFSKTYPLIRYGTGDLAMNVDPNPGHSQQEERAVMLVGRVGDAVKVRGMFVHPNQLRFVAGQIPGILAVQGVVTRPADRDIFTLRVAMADGVPLEAIAEPFKQAVRGVCRVTVDAIETGVITPEMAGMVDERDWQG
jgi:phenylacetate-CoA ligase